jgi:hypothetical protein
MCVCVCLIPLEIISQCLVDLISPPPNISKEIRDDDGRAAGGGGKQQPSLKKKLVNIY